MSRSWNQCLRLLAVAGLTVLSAVALAQNAELEVQALAPAAASGPADVLLYQPAAAAPQGEFELVLSSPTEAAPQFFAFAPQAQRQLAAEGQRLSAQPFLFTQGAAPPIEARVKIAEEAEEASPSAGEYWIGVQLEPLPEIITSQLKLERGMVVVQVFKDSPAAKAELKTNDIILRAADKDIKEPQDLISAVNEAKDKEIAIVALRGGTETTLRVTPTKRRADRIELRLSPDTPHAEVVLALEKLYQRAPDGGVRLLAVRPGGVFAYAQTAKFPSNLEITIEKRGDKPATIRVKRIQEGEDKNWEVTEDKLSELPEDIRGHVQQMLGGREHATPQALRLRLDESRAHAQTQAAKAQDAASQAHAQVEQLQQHLREYRVRVQPAAPGANPPIAVSPPTPTREIVLSPRTAERSIQSKLDAILKKLDQQQGEALQRLQKEVERLRQEVEQMRQEKK